MDSLADALARVGARRSAAIVVDRSGVVESTGPIDDVFALASVTKIATAFATLVAIEEGIVALDDSVGPEGSTLRHLLAHASGLGSEASDPILAPPGTRRVYSNAGFELIGVHVARASGMEFAAYLAESVFTPLGMTASTLVGAPSRGASSTCRDLARFVAELLAPTLVAPETLAGATTVAFAGLDGVLPGYGEMSPCDWGLGFEIRDHKRPHWTGATNSPVTFGHFGRSGTCCSVDPELGLAIVALSDRQFGATHQAAWPALADGAIARHQP